MRKKMKVDGEIFYEFKDIQGNKHIIEQTKTSEVSLGNIIITEKVACQLMSCIAYFLDNKKA